MFHNNPHLGLVAFGVLCLLTLATGVWLSTLGRPLSTPVFALHKLLTLGLVVLVYFLVRPHVGALMADKAALACAVLAAAGLLSLFVSGGVLGLDLMPRTVMLRAHAIAAGLFLGGSSLTAWLLIR